jgi:hypothetical protein
MENGAHAKKDYSPNGNLHPLEGVAMAFGPGLVIEMARMVYVPPMDIQASVSTSISASISTKGEGAGFEDAYELDQRPEGIYERT